MNDSQYIEQLEKENDFLRETVNELQVQNDCFVNGNVKGILDILIKNCLQFQETEVAKQAYNSLSIAQYLIQFGTVKLGLHRGAGHTTAIYQYLDEYPNSYAYFPNGSNSIMHRLGKSLVHKTNINSNVNDISSRIIRNINKGFRGTRIFCEYFFVDNTSSIINENEMSSIYNNLMICNTAKTKCVVMLA